MNLIGRILIIDDEEFFRQSTRRTLEDEGYEVAEAHDVTSALQQIQQSEWDILLLDQRLNGSGGGNIGLDNLKRLLSAAPESRLIIATGYADDAAILRAFEAGAYDYLEKNLFFDTFLKLKVKRALELPRATRLMRMSDQDREEAIAETWKAVGEETDSYKKGPLLERLLELIFRSIPGLDEVRRNVRNEQEEIDLILTNRLSAAPFSKESPYIIVECKNWSKPVGKDEFILFKEKHLNRYGRCSLGIFIALGGFTGTFTTEQLTNRKEDVLILMLGKQDLEALVRSEDRLALLETFHARALMAGNGH